MRTRHLFMLALSLSVAACASEIQPNNIQDPGAPPTVQAPSEIFGQILLEGGGAAMDAEVSVDGTEVERGIVDSDNRFRITDVVAGTYTLRVSMTGYRSFSLPALRVGIGEEIDMGVITLELVRGTIAGEVSIDGSDDFSGVTVNLEGQNAPDSVAQALRPAQGMPDGGPPPAGPVLRSFATLTGRNGNWLISGVPEGFYLLTASRPDHSLYCHGLVQVTEAAGTLEITGMRLVPSSGVVRVLDDDGLPLEATRDRQVDVNLLVFGVNSMRSAPTVEALAQAPWVPFNSFLDDEELVPAGPDGAEPEDGPVTRYFQFLDGCELESEPFAATVLFDRTPPRILSATLNNGSAHLTDDSGLVTLDIEAEDLTSGVKRIFVEVDGEPLDAGEGRLFTRQLVLGVGPEEGPHTVRVRVEDAAGNSSETAEVTIIRDTKPPEPADPALSVVEAEGGVVGSLDITLALDFGGEPAEMAIRNSPGTEVGPWQPFAPFAAWSLVAGEDGERQVFVRVRDAAGNMTDELIVVLQLDRAGGIRGIARRDDGGAVAGIDVSISGMEGATPVAEDGSFSISLAAGVYTVVLTGPELTTLRLPGIAVVEGTVTELGEVVLSVARGNVAGSVAIAGREDLSGVLVEALGARISATTNAQGEYALRGLPARVITLQATLADHESGSVEVSVLADDEVSAPQITLQPQPGALEGQFLLEGVTEDDGHGGTGVELRGTGVSGTTEADGRFTFDTVLPGIYTLFTTRADYGRFETVVVVRAGQTTALDAQTLSRARGDVVGSALLSDADDHAGVSVRLEPTDGGRGFDAVTGGTGDFRIDGVFAGEYSAVASRAGYESASSLPFTVDAGALVTVPALNLAPVPGSLRGTATLAGATDHAGIRIEVGSTGLNSSTDAAGAFTVDTVPAGTYVLGVTAEGYSRRELIAVIEPGGETVVDVPALVLARGAIVGRARLLGPPDVPEDGHAGIRVEVAELGLSALTSARGDFRIDGVPVGERSVTAVFEGWFDSLPVSVTVAEDQDAATEDIELAPNPGTVSGSATLEDGGPHDSIEIDLEGSGLSARASATGEYTIDPVPSGSYTVTATAPGYDAVQSPIFSVAPGGAANLSALVLARSRGTVFGTAQLAATNDHSGITIEVEGTPFTAITGSTGSWRIEGLPTDSYTIVARRDGYAPQSWSSVSVTPNGESDVGLRVLARRSGDFLINGGAGVTSDPDVLLDLSFPDAVEFRVSEDDTFTDPALGDTAYRPFDPDAEQRFTLQLTQGGHTVYVTFRDSGGSESQLLSARITLDTEAPVALDLQIDGGVHYTRDRSRLVSVRVVAEDLTSGVELVILSNDDAVFDEAERRFSPVAGRFEATIPGYVLSDGDDGDRNVQLRLVDAAGNASDIVDIVCPSFDDDPAAAEDDPRCDTIRLDRTDPVISAFSIAVGADFVQSASVALDVAAADENGLSRLFIVNGTSFGAAQQRAFEAAPSWFLTGGEGEKTVSVWVQDPAGNLSLASSDTVIVDSVLPAGSLQLEGTTVGGAASAEITSVLDLTLRLAGNDAGAGLAQMQISDTTDFSQSALVDFALSAAHTLPEGNDGLRTVYVRIIDGAGNAVVVSASIALDRTVPSGSVSIDAGAMHSQDGTLDLALSAIDVNGVPQVAIAASQAGLDAAEPEAFSASKSFTHEGDDGLIRVWARFFDAAGNSSDAFDEIVVDRADPTGELTIADGADVVNTRLVTLELDFDADVVEISAHNGAFDCVAGAPAWSAALRSFTHRLADQDGLREVTVCLRDAAQRVGSLRDAVTLDRLGDLSGVLALSGSADASVANVELLGVDGAGNAVSQSVSPVAAGDWGFDDVAAGRYTLRFSAPGFVSEQEAFALTPGQDIDFGTRTLVRRRATVTGHLVLDLAGSGLSIDAAGTVVVLALGAERRAAVTDANGDFRFESVPFGAGSLYSLRARRPHFAEGVQSDIEISEATVVGGVRSLDDTTLTLRVGAVDGSVSLAPRDDHGGATVFLRGSAFNGEAVETAAVSVDAGDGVQGTFDFAGVPPGSYQVEVAATSFGVERSELFAVDDGATTTLPRIPLAALRVDVEGTLSLDAAGTGLTLDPADTAVFLSNGSFSASAVADDTGAFVFNAVPYSVATSYTVSASRQFFTSATLTAVAVDDAQIDALREAVVLAPMTLNLRTGDIDGGVTLLGQADHAGATATLNGTAFSGEAVTRVAPSTDDGDGERGSYSFEGLPPGRYQVDIASDGYVSRSTGNLTVVPGETALAPLVTLGAQEAVVAGRVALDASGTGLSLDAAGIPVQLSGGGFSATAVTDAGGDYRFAAVPFSVVSTYTVTASLPRFGSESEAGVVVDAAAVTAGGGSVQVNELTLRLQTGEIQGTVSLAGASDHAGASITLAGTAFNGEAVATVVPSIDDGNGTSGSYSLPGLAPGSYSLDVSAVGRQSVSTGTLTVVGGGTTTVDLVSLLPEEATLTGSVNLDANGTGLTLDAGGVRVQLSGGGYDATTVTDDSGDYRFDRVPYIFGGSYTVSAARARFVGSPVTGIAVAAPLVAVNAITLTLQTGSIAGQIALDGLADHSSATATVRGTAFNGEEVTLAAPVTDDGNGATGSYGILGLAPGSYEVVISAPGFASKSTGTLTVGPGGAAAPAQVALERQPATVSGAVLLNASGTGLTLDDSGIPVTITGGSFSAATVTDASGAYSFAGVPFSVGTTYTVSASLPNFSSDSEAGIDVAAASVAVNDLTLALLTGSIAGDMSLSGLANHAGATATATGTAFNGESVTSAVATTDDGNGATGSYDITGLPPGTFEVVVSETGFVSQSTGTLTVSPGAATNPAQIDLGRQSATVSGSVLLNASGTGLTLDDLGIPVTISGGSFSAATVTDASGAYSFAGVPFSVGTTYTVGASLPNFSSDSEAGIDVAAASVAVNDLTLVLQTGSIAGAMSLSGLANHADATATATGTAFNGESVTSAVATIDDGNGATGSYDITALPPGTYEVVVSEAGFVSTSTGTLTVSPGAATNPSQLDLVRQEATVSGAVLLNASGTGLTLDDSGIPVTISGGSFSAATVTDASGAYSFSGVPYSVGTTYTVSASLQNFSSDSEAGINVAAASVAVNDLTLVLQTGSIAGNMSLSGLASHADATATATGTAFNGESVTSAVATTDDGNGATGSYDVTGLPPGTYEVVVSETGFVSESTGTLTVSPSAATNPAQLDLVREEATVSGSVLLNASGTGLTLDDSGVTVTISGGSFSAATVTDASGAYSFAGVPFSVGTAYTVSASLQNFTGDSEAGINVAAASVAVNDLTLVLQTGSIAGNMSLSGLANHADATATATGTAFNGESVTSAVATTDDGNGATGSYDITGLPPGTYEVVVSETGFVSESTGTLTVSPGAATSPAQLDLGRQEATVSGSVLLNASATGLTLDDSGIPVTISGGSFSAATVTDASGAYSFAGVPFSVGTSYTVSASLQNFSSDSEAGIDVAAASVAVNDLTLVLQTGSIAGNMSLSGLANHADATATATGTAFNGESATSAVATTDDGNGTTGSYDITGLPPGTYEVVVSETGFVSESTGTLTVSPSAATNPAQLDLTREEATVSGSVLLNASGTGLTLDDSGIPVTISGGSFSAATVTDASGAYSFAGVPFSVGTTYTVSASLQNFSSDSEAGINVAAASVAVNDLTLVLQTGSIAGNMSLGGLTNHADATATATGTAFNGESVTSAVATTDDGNTTTGSYDITGLPPGTYEVVVSETGFVSESTGTLTVSPSAATNPAQLDLVREEATVSGSVLLNASGTGLTLDDSGIPVTISGGSFSAATVTDASGAYSFAGVPFSVGTTYTVSASLPNFSSDSETGINVAATSVAVNDLTLALQTGTIDGSVTLAGLANHAGVTATVAGTAFNGEPIVDGGTSTDDGNGTTGSYSVSGLPPGSYEVTLTRTSYETESTGTLTVEAGGTTTAPASTLSLTEADVIGNVALNLAGTGLSVDTSGTLVVISNGSYSASTLSDAAGDYRFKNVPYSVLGAYTVTATRTSFNSQSQASITVSDATLNASEDAVVVSDLTLTLQVGTLRGDIVLANDVADGSGVAGSLSGIAFNGENVVIAAADALTGTNGRYTFSSVPPGSYSVTLSKAEYGPESSAAQTVEPGGTTTVSTLTLLPLEATVSGNIAFDAGSTGLDVSGSREGVTVRLTNSYATVVTTTDSSGDFTFTGVPYDIGDDYTLRGNLYGYAINTTSVNVDQATVSNADLTLSVQTAAVRGRQQQASTADNSGAVPTVSGVAFNGAAYSVTCAGCATNTFGIFAVNNLPAGSFSVTLSKTNWVDGVSPAFALVPGGTENVGSLPTMPLADGDITGNVTLASAIGGFSPGSDHSGILVELSAGGTLLTSTVTNSDGNYSFSDVKVSPTGAAHGITARAANYGSSSTTVTVVQDTSTAVSNLTLNVQGGTVTGTAKIFDNVGGGGANANSAGISIDLSGTAFNSSSFSASTTTSTSGSWSLTPLPPGTYTLTASLANHESRTNNSVTVSAGQTTALAQVGLADSVAPGAPTIATTADARINAASASVTIASAATDDTSPTSNLRGYQLRGGSSYSDWTFVAGSGPFTFNLNSDTSNLLQVRALDWVGNVSDADSLIVYEDSTNPSNPSNVRVIERDGEVQVLWDASSSSDVAGYRLYYGAQPGNTLADYTGNFAEQGQSPIDVGNNTTFTLTGLVNDTTFKVVVSAYDSTTQPGPNESSGSSAVNVQPTEYPLEVTAQMDLDGAHEIMLLHGYAYISNSVTGMNVYRQQALLSATDASPITQIDRVTLAKGRKLATYGDVIYNFGPLTNGLRCITVLNHESIGSGSLRLSTRKIDAFITGHRISGEGTYGYMVYRLNSSRNNIYVQRVNLSNPTIPSTMNGSGTLVFTDSDSSNDVRVSDIEIMGDKLYISFFRTPISGDHSSRFGTSGLDEISVYDISDSTSAPSKLAADSEDWGVDVPESIDIGGEDMYVSTYNEIYYADTDTGAKQGNVEPLARSGDFQVIGQYGYVPGATQGIGMMVFDVSDGVHPSLVGQHFDSGLQSIAWETSMAIDGNHAYVVYNARGTSNNDTGRLRIYRLSERRTVFPEITLDDATFTSHAMHHSNIFVTLQFESTAIRAFDIRSGVPSIKSDSTLGSELPNAITGISRLYDNGRTMLLGAATANSGGTVTYEVMLIDVSDPRNLRYLGGVDWTNERIYDLEMDGNSVYVATEDKIARAYRVTNPSSWVDVARYPADPSTSAGTTLSRVGRHLYGGEASTDKVFRFTVSDTAALSSSPLEMDIGSSTLAVVRAHGDQIYVNTAFSSLEIYDRSEFPNLSSLESEISNPLGGAYLTPYGNVLITADSFDRLAVYNIDDAADPFFEVFVETDAQQNPDMHGPYLLGGSNGPVTLFRMK